MDFELEVHPVGDASRAGDAISLRYWDSERFQIIVVDGGTDTSGEVLVEHIKAYYGADAKIAHVISTHPDTDHACGLRAILTNLRLALSGCMACGTMPPRCSNISRTRDGPQLG